MRLLRALFLVFILALLVQEGNMWWRRRRRRRRCPVRNCSVSGWSSWSGCSHECGSGVQTRTRRKTGNEACGGSCPYSFRETRACNRHCPNGGTPRGSICACRVGFTGRCCRSDVNECVRKPCQHICDNSFGSYTCRCHTCYTKVGTRCDLRRCKISNKCYNYGTANPSNFCQHCRASNKYAWTNNNGQRCNDQNVRTKNDQCLNGACVGTAYRCLSCEQHDGSGCRLKAGFCVIQHKGARTCFSNNQVNPSNQCQKCNANKKHTWTNIHGSPCNDQNVQTKNDHCVNGACVGTVYRCLRCEQHDGKGCPLKAGQCVIQHKGARTCFSNNQLNPSNQCQKCDPNNKNTWTNIKGSCNDRDVGTRDDRCVNGACKGTPYTCLSCEQHDGTGCPLKAGYCSIQRNCFRNKQINPSNQCQQCDANKKHTWTNINGRSCNDNDVRTKNDRCFNGACVGTRYTCLSCEQHDGSGCPLKAGYCLIQRKCFSNKQVNPSNQCQKCNANNKHAWTNINGSPCNDQNVRTRNDRCVNGACVGTSYTCLPCEQHDGNDCQLKAGYCVIQHKGIRTCFSNKQINPSNQCQKCDTTNNHTWTNISGSPCNDQNVRTRNDSCVKGACVGTPYKCLSCEQHDGIGCQLKAGHCVIQHKGIKKCFSYKQVNPSNQCQKCMVNNKYSWTNINGSPCNDQNFRTRNDSCVNGACVGTPYTCLPCEQHDGKGCRLKAGYCVIRHNGVRICFRDKHVNPFHQCQECNVKIKDKWTVNNNLSCTDNNMLTRHDRCVNGTCVGTPYSCLSCEQHDGKGCQLKQGFCVIQLNGVRTCFNNKQVNPSNPCKQCNVKNKYIWTNNNSLPCNDSDLRTRNDRCLNGECGGTPYSCLPCEQHDGTECQLKAGYCVIQQNRVRTCFRNKQVNPLNPCQLCKPSVSDSSWTNKAIVDGNWTSWGDWSVCSKSCKSGYQSRQRNCTNPPPSECGKTCTGQSVESRTCNTQPCPVNGGWTRWGSWSKCSKSCEGGKQKRARRCFNPPPSFGGLDCTGPRVETRECSKHRCPVECKSSLNGEYPHYSNCSKYVACSGGKKYVRCCPAGFHFNPVTKRCDLPQNVNCTTREEQYVAMGCFADRRNSRAFTKFLVNLRDDIDWYDLKKTVQACAKKVRELCGWKYFGIQFYGECWGGQDKSTSYDMHGKSTSCVMGVGKEYTNYVYKMID